MKKNEPVTDIVLDTKAPRKTTLKVMEEVKAIKITSSALLIDASNLFLKIKKAQKLMAAEKEKMMRPLLTAVNVERGRWKDPENELIQAETLIEAKIKEYNRVTREEAERKQAQIDARVEKGTMREDTAMVKKLEIQQPQKAVFTNLGSMTEKNVKKVEIFDESLVPREYCDVNEVRVRKAALSGIEIPGVRVVDDTVIAGKV